MPPSATEIDEIWALKMGELGLSAARMLTKSKYDPFRRIYLFDNEVLKIVLHEHENTARLRRTDPSSEYRILESLRPVRSVPDPLGFTDDEEVSILRMEFREGESLRTIKMSKWAVFSVVGRIASTLFSLSMKGVAHNDLTPNNIILDDRQVTLLDFDQATHVSVIGAFAANFAPWERQSRGRFGSLFMLAGFLIIHTNPGLASALRHLPGHFSNIDRDQRF